MNFAYVTCDELNNHHLGSYTTLRSKHGNSATAAIGILVGIDHQIDDGGSNRRTILTIGLAHSTEDEFTEVYRSDQVAIGGSFVDHLDALKEWAQPNV